MYLTRQSNNNTGLYRALPGRRAFLTILIPVILTLAVALPCAAQYPTVTVTEPDGSGDKINAAKDFATKKFQDPWDMAQETDFHYFIDQFRDSGFTSNGGDPVWTGVSLATPQTGDPENSSDCSIIILHPGDESAVNAGRKGVNTPIDASSYRYLSLRMYVSQDSYSQVVWFNDVNHWPPLEGDISSSEFFPVYEGWRVYTIDLAALPMIQGPTWGGTVYGLRLDPSFLKNVRVTGYTTGLRVGFIFRW